MSFVYIIPILLAVIYSIIHDRQIGFNVYKSRRFWLLYVIMSLITGLSYALGGDKQTYLTEFSHYSSNLSDILKEIELGFLLRGQMPGWVIINCVAKALFNSFYVVQLIQAFFVNYAVFYTIKRYTHRVFWAVILYCISLTYFVFNLEVMREAFAVGFFLLGTDAYYRKKYIYTAILFLFACLFHSSAIIILLFPLLRFRVTPKRFVFFLLAPVFLFIYSNTIYELFVNVLSRQDGALFSKALISISYSTPIIPFFLYTAIYVIAPFWIMHLALNKGITNKNKLRQKEQFMTFYLCIAVIVPNVLTLARFLNYGRIVFLCMTADLLYSFISDRRHILSVILSVLLSWGYPLSQYFAINKYTGTSFMDLFFPYTSILNENDYDRMYRILLHDSTISDGPSGEYSRD